MPTRSPLPLLPDTTRGARLSWLATVRAYHQCSQLLERRLGAIGVRTAEHEILANLLLEPGLSQQALARRCYTAKSHVSGLIATLEARGWVNRAADPRDARAKQLTLTPDGERIARRSLEVQQGVIALMAAPCGDGEFGAIRTTMDKISLALEAAWDAPDPSAP